MKKFTIKDREGKYGRRHQLYIIDNVLFFDTANEEYGLGFISLRQLEEFISIYKSKKFNLDYKDLGSNIKKDGNGKR